MSTNSSASEAGATPKPNLRQIYKMRVTDIRDYTSSIRELFVQCDVPEEFHFRAGQFVMLHVPADPKPLLRAYSIASDENRKNGFRLVFKFVETGAASNYVWALKGGEELHFTGPFGRVFFREPPTPQIVFMNTGSGVSQHFSFIESNLKKYPGLKYRLLFGVRSEIDIYYEDELKRLKSQLTDFEYDYVLSRPSASWQGKHGYIQHHVDDFDYLNIPTTFYLCGNGAMIKDIKAKLAQEVFDPTHILSEAFD